MLRQKKKTMERDKGSISILNSSSSLSWYSQQQWILLISGFDRLQYQNNIFKTFWYEHFFFRVKSTKSNFSIILRSPWFPSLYHFISIQIHSQLYSVRIGLISIEFYFNLRFFFQKCSRTLLDHFSVRTLLGVWVLSYAFLFSFSFFFFRWYVFYYCIYFSWSTGTKSIYLFRPKNRYL